MSSSRQDPPPNARRRASRRRSGFTLLELGLFLLCLLLAGSIALSEVKKIRHRTERDRFIAEVRGLAAAFESFQAEKGAWPAATNPDNRLPRGMETALAGTPWLAGSPFGGNYDWIPPAPVEAGGDDAANRPPPSGKIAVTAFSPASPLRLTAADLRYIDEKLDDGDPATGRFRSGFNGWPVYLVRASR